MDPVDGADGASAGGGGIWNWDDLPPAVQDEFMESYFYASMPAHQRLVNEAFFEVKGD